MWQYIAKFAQARMPTQLNEMQMPHFLKYYYYYFYLVVSLFLNFSSHEGQVTDLNANADPLALSLRPVCLSFLQP